jgi:Leucine-rich repeat (LRR) protein
VLADIDLSDNPKLASMDWLYAQNYTTLKKLDLSRTDLAADDLAWIAKCPELTDLSLDGVALTDLSCVSGLTNLRNISAINCGLEDISGLSESPQLEEILLSCNNIKSVAALSGLSLEKRPTIELTNNAVESVAELPVGEYYALMLYGNAGNVADTLPEGIKAYEVSTAYFDEVRGTSLADVTNTLRELAQPGDLILTVGAGSIYQAGEALVRS